MRTIPVVTAAVSLVAHSVASAQVLLNPHEIVSTSDYPTNSIRAGDQGVTTFEVTLDRNAKATACKIIVSSGHSELDDTTCRLVIERGRFELARGQANSGKGSRYTNRIRWVLPSTADAATSGPPLAVQVYQGGRPCALPGACSGNADAYRLDGAYSSSATTSTQKQMMEYLILQNTSSISTDWSSAAQQYFSWREAASGNQFGSASPPAMQAQPARPYSSLTKNNLCREMKKARKTGAASYPAYVMELSNRGLTEQNCAAQWGKILLGVAAVGLVAAAASSGGTSGSQTSNFYGATRTEDVSYSWDQQPNGNGGRQWVCRGEQTGQYADLSLCAYKIKVDTRWPG